MSAHSYLIRLFMDSVNEYFESERQRKSVKERKVLTKGCGRLISNTNQSLMLFKAIFRVKNQLNEKLLTQQLTEKKKIIDNLTFAVLNFSYLKGKRAARDKPNSYE